MDYIQMPRRLGPDDATAQPCRVCNDTRMLQDKPCPLCRPLPCAVALRDETHPQAPPE